MPWIAITQEMVQASMSEDLLLLFSDWLQNPQKQEYFTFLVNNTTNEFRMAISNNPTNILGPAGTIPDSCARHAINIIIGTILMQFPQPLTPEARNAMEKADIFLRQIGYGKYRIEPGGEGGASLVNTPHYNPGPFDREERVLSCFGV